MKTLLSGSILFAVLFSSNLFAQNTLDKAGLTAATPSAVAFSLRQLSSAYSGPAIKVRRSSDNAEATVAFDGSGGVSASSMVTFTPGVAVGAMGVPQTGTISSDVNKTGTITSKVARSGYIITTASSSTVTGLATSFTTELVVGDRLFNASNNIFIGVVASITNNSSLQLTNYATTAVTLSMFKTTKATVTGTGTNFTGELVVGDRLFTTSHTYVGTVAAITSATALTLQAVDAVAVTGVNFKGTSATITGTGTNFTSLSVGSLLISNNITLGIISSIINSTTLTLTTKAGGSVSGLAFRATPGTILFSTYYASTSVYVNTWYDQSDNDRDAVQLKPTNQARIVNAGTLYVVNGRTSLEFSSSLTSFLQTSTVASYLDNTLYTLNKVTAEATINPNLQFPISTTGGSGPGNTISYYGYRSSSQFTVGQYNNDENFAATPSTTLELHTSVKLSTASSQFYKNGVSLGIVTSSAPSNLTNVGLLNIGFYTPSSSYYGGSISELTVFSSALSTANLNLLDDNQLDYYDIATTYWTGAVSTDWSLPGNWSTGVVPTITNPSIVVIPAGKPHYPVISGIAPANSISLETGTSLTINGTLQLAGTITNDGTCTATAGTIHYLGTAPQGISANTFVSNTIRNVLINNATSVTMNTNLTVSTNLTFTSGHLNLNTATLTIGGSVTNTVTGGLRGSANSSLIVNGTVSPTLSFDQTTVGTTNLLKNLTINSNGHLVNLANNLVMHESGATTFTAGKLAIGSSTLTIKGIIVNTVNEGIRGGLSSNLIVDGTVSPVLSFDQTTPGTTNALGNLTLNCSGQTATLNKNLVIASTMNLVSGVLADGGNQVTSTGTINITGGTFKLGSPAIATTWPAFSANNFSTNGTVEYASGISQTASSAPVYQNLTISATGGAVATADITVNGILTLSAANPSAFLGSLAMGTHTLNMGTSATTVGQGDVTGIVKRTTILPNISYTMGNEFSNITFPNTGTLPTQISMRITIGTAPSWQPGTIKRFYDFIQTGGNGTKAVINSHYLDSELNGNTENKLVDFSYRVAGTVLTEHGKSGFNTTQNWVGLSNVNVAFFSSTFGNLELSFDESSLTTLTWTGASSTSWITATNWFPNGGPSTNTNLIIPDASTTLNDPYLPATASNGSVTIEAGGIVNADPGAQLTLNNPGLVWSNYGTFNASSSTVLFTNANATINGTTDFDNVTINTGASLQMSSGTVMRIGGTMTNDGTWAPGLLDNTVVYNGNNQTILIPNGPTQSYYNLILDGTGTSVLPPASLNILGDLSINNAISTTGNTVAMNGMIAQTISGSSPITLNNLLINNSHISGVSLTQSLNVSNALSINTGKLAIGANTLTLSGNVVNTIPNGIKGSSSSNLVLNSIASPVISFDQTVPGTTNALNDIIINSPGQSPLLGSDLEVNGTMTFTAGKLGINGNTLVLRGTVVNTVPGGLVGSSTSSLQIDDVIMDPVLSFDQTIDGTTNLLNDLSINSSGRIVSFSNPLFINGVLTLAGGIINTSSVNSLTINANGSISGGSDISFIDGPLVRKTGGTGLFDFPVGKMNTYRPVSITPTTSLAGLYTGEYFPVIAPAGAQAIDLTAIATNEYWNVNRTSGPDAEVSLVFNGTSTWSLGSPTSMDAIFVSNLNSGTWNTAYGTAIPGNTGSSMSPLKSRIMTSFSSFTFGFSPHMVLPVTLIDFKAIAVNQDIQLLWISANEYSFANYELERSADGRSFYKLASVKATNTSAVKTYTWMDNTPLTGTSFYRLKMVDIDGRFKYSSIIKIDRSAKKGISVYPNPVTDHTIQLQMYGQAKGNHTINLYNNSGMKVMSTIISHDGNSTVQSIVLSKLLEHGMYYLEIVDPEKERTSLKIVVQ